MKTKLNIIWSPLAEEIYLTIIKFILETWTNKEAMVFDKKVESLITKLRAFKNLCPPSEIEKFLRRCVISKQTSLVYQIIDNTTIELISFYDNRSNQNIR